MLGRVDSVVLALGAVLCALSSPLPVRAQEPDVAPESSEAPDASETDAEQADDPRVHPSDDDLEFFPDEQHNVSDRELREEGFDPCALNEEGNWIDWLNRKVTKSVCGSARWFDSFFATENEFDSRDSTFGRLGVGAFWDEDDGVDPEFRFRGKWNLPNLENRVQVVAGRGSLDEVLDGEDTSSPAEEFFDEESEWLVGFKYNVQFGNKARLSPSVGASWSSGLDPYVRLRYLYQLPFNENRTQFRLKITPQWQESKGAGYTFRPTIDHTLSDRLLLRFDVSIKDFEERFEGFSYGTYLNLFQKLSRRNALRWKVGLVSQSKLEHQPQDIGGSIAWRTTVYKEIFILESTVGTTFRRRPGEPEREAELILGLVAELKFGR